MSYERSYEGHLEDWQYRALRHVQQCYDDYLEDMTTWHQLYSQSVSTSARRHRDVLAVAKSHRKIAAVAAFILSGRFYDRPI